MAYQPKCVAFVAGAKPKRKCPFAARYWIHNGGRGVNRLLCGFHAMWYIKQNKGREFANRVTGEQQKLPYTIVEDFKPFYR